MLIAFLQLSLALTREVLFIYTTSCFCFTIVVFGAAAMNPNCGDTRPCTTLMRISRHLKGRGWNINEDDCLVTWQQGLKTPVDVPASIPPARLSNLCPRQPHLLTVEDIRWYEAISDYLGFEIFPVLSCWLVFHLGVDISLFALLCFSFGCTARLEGNHCQRRCSFGNGRETSRNVSLSAAHVCETDACKIFNELPPLRYLTFTSGNCGRIYLYMVFNFPSQSRKYTVYSYRL